MEITDRGIEKYRNALVDGNKRIALIAVYNFLAINGVELTALFRTGS